MEDEFESRKKEIELALLKSRLNKKLSERERVATYVKINALEGKIESFSDKTENLIDEYLNLKSKFNIGLRGQNYIEVVKRYNQVKELLKI